MTLLAEEFLLLSKGSTISDDTLHKWGGEQTQNGERESVCVCVDERLRKEAA